MNVGGINLPTDPLELSHFPIQGDRSEDNQVGVALDFRDSVIEMEQMIGELAASVNSNDDFEMPRKL